MMRSTLRNLVDELLGQRVKVSLFLWRLHHGFFEIREFIDQHYRNYFLKPEAIFTEGKKIKIENCRKDGLRDSLMLM
jgi:hypothetical protein